MANWIRRRELIAKEDLSNAVGTFSRTTSTGGTQTLHSFDILDAITFAGATVTNQIDAAVAEAASTPTLIVIPSGMGAGSPSAFPSNVVIADLRGGTPLSGGLGNSISLGSSSGSTNYMVLLQALNASPSNSTLAIQSMNAVSGAIGASQTQGAGLDQIYTTGAITSVGSGAVLAGRECVATIASTGSTVPDIRALTCNVTSAAASTTNITDAKTIVVQSFSKAGSGSITNMYGLVCENQNVGTSRNYAAWLQGNILLSNGTVTNGSYIAQMDAAGAIHRLLSMGGAQTAGTPQGIDTVTFSPVNDSNGFVFSNSAQNASYLNINSNGSVFTGLVGINTPSSTPGYTFDLYDTGGGNDTPRNIALFRGTPSQGAAGYIALEVETNASATAGNRFAGVQSADGTSTRSLILNRQGGNVGIGSAFGTGVVPATKLHGTESTILGVAGSAVSSALMGGNQVNLWIDEGANALNLQVKYSGGTVKTASIALT